MARRSARSTSALRAFLASETAGGIVLLAATALALIAANSAVLAPIQQALLDTTIGPAIDPAHGALSIRLWINDGLMAVFFLLVGLEIKRELIDGELARPAARRLPVIAAAAGMAVPALVYLVITRHDPALTRGWAIPSATDIAFAIGVMALLGRRAPAPLRLLLTTIAIVDDLGAVAIIAIAYTDHLDGVALAAAAGVAALLYAVGRRHPRALWPYFFGFAVIWLLMFRSGVHATIAGVVVATLVPITRSPGAPDDAQSPLHRLEHALGPWVAFAIVPLFAFANAGVQVTGAGLASALGQPLVIAITAGLFFGKQAGILGGVALAERTGIARRPAGMSWTQLYGLALLAGIGFTMSLFIGGLAFPGQPVLQDEVRIGVLLGSLLSGVAGALVLAMAARGRRHQRR
ncbi:Na+/H+ antiporter NhaA [Sphingomonas sp. GlSt437]|uniref:Na+/H+ antiporter NhaA n=1 Tax=Sphingomonas sp. GlSt437 TaxID=3389970 RepID=UPI003A873B7D